MDTMHFEPGQRVILANVNNGDLVTLPSGKLAMRKEWVSDELIAVAYCNGLSEYGSYIYISELLAYSTECEFVLAKEILYGVLLRSQEVRDLICALQEK